MKVQIGATPYYLWWPVCGRAKDTVLMDTNEVHKNIEAILNKVGEPKTVRCGACGIEASLPEKCAVCGKPYREEQLP